MTDPRPDVVARLIDAYHARLLGDPAADVDWQNRREWSTGAERSLAFHNLIAETEAVLAMATAAVDQQDAGPQYDAATNRFIEFDQAEWLDSIGVAYDSPAGGDAS